MIENIFNYKQIPTYFLYNNSEEYTALKKQKLLKAPPHELVIDLKDFTSYEEILLNKILYILKNEGGHLLIGCQKM